MNDIIYIKCPFDGAVLSVKNQPGIEHKNVTCPICKQKFPFTQFKQVVPSNKNEDPDTEYPSDDERTSYNKPNEETDLGNMNYNLGTVKLMGTNYIYQLRIGRNIIGRRASNSEANIQIDTAGKRSMSREHAVIEVKKVPGKGYVHYISLYKEKVNKTYIGNEPLLFGDCIILNHGDVIKLPDANLIFELLDNEGTQL